MNDPKVSRRVFLQQGILAGVALGSGLLWSSCGSGNKELSCNDTTGLSAQEIQTRQQLKYVDKTPDPNKPCDRCQFFLPGGESKCGGCQLVKGPIHPKGYCTAWVQKKA